MKRAHSTFIRTALRRVRARPRLTRETVTRRLPVRHRGALLFPIPDDEIYAELARGRGFESRELTFVEQILQEGDIFWDLGANFGLYSVAAAREVGQSGHVLAIEPDPRNLRRLRANLLINRRRNVTVIGAAVGESSGVIDFQSCDQGAYSGVRLGDHPGTVRTITVPQTTLALLLNRSGRGPTMVKMDIEGSELFALRGGSEVFERSRPIVLAEFSDRRTAPYGYAAAEIYDWLQARGYTMLRFDTASRLVHDERRHEYDADNLVACPSEALDQLRPWLAG